MDSRLRDISAYLLPQKDWSAVNPASIAASLLPLLFVLDIERSEPGLKLRIRLIGTAIDNVFRRPLKGHLLEEFIHGPRGKQVIESFHHCAATREPVWMRQVVPMKDSVPRLVEGVAVYLAQERIYGGLIVGEAALPSNEATFERRILTP
jgi:hypothetical protein